MSVTETKSLKIGHNKYQIEIHSLKDEIKQLNDIINNQQAELSLFKNNFYSINNNLQAKNILLEDSNTKISNLTIENSQLYDKIENINKMNLFLIHNLENDKNNLINEKETYLKHSNDIHHNHSELQSKYTNLKTKYQDLYILLEQKNTNFNKLETAYSLLNKELILKNELYNNLLNEKKNITNELYSSHNEVTHLKNIIFDKDNCIKDLNKRFTNSIPQLQHFKESYIPISINIPLIPNDSEPQKYIPPLTIEENTFSRRLKLSNRGFTS